MPIAADLPVWNPDEPPEATPPVRSAAWASRIGAPGAVFLGRIRPRLIGAAISVLFIPVGAARILVGMSSPQSATDPWGPADAFVIVAAIAGVVALLAFVRSARTARASAAHSAQVILRQANPGVTQEQIASVLQSTDRFDEWARTARIEPFTGNAAAVDGSAEGARLMFARSRRGTTALWKPRFGDSLSRAFLATRIQAWIGMVLVVGAVALDAVALVAAVILYRERHPGPNAGLPALQIVLLVAFVVGWVLVLVARYGPRGRFAILDAVVPVLAARDPKVTRTMVGAMFARPYMYDLWVIRHPAA